MIELRWVKPTHWISDDRRESRNILQYRVIENVMEIGVQEPIYSAWLDVPTVREEDS